MDQQNHRYILAEAVYAVLEVKPEINKTYLSAAAGKARSVRSLHRTSVPIPSAEKILPAKRLFPILGGIVAARVEWSDGLKAAAFSDALIALQGEETLSVGVALQDHAFDLAFASVEPQLTHGPLSLSPSKQGSLAWFLFNLLKRLQDLGTCPAVDWNRYRAVLSTID